MNNKSKLIQVLINIIIILNYFILVDSFINMGHVVVLLIVLLGILTLIKKKEKLVVDKTDILFIVFGIFCVITSFLSFSGDGIGYSVYLIFSILFGICLKNLKEYKVGIGVTLKNISIIFAIFTILFYVFPNLVNYIYPYIYNSNRVIELKNLLSIGGSAGLAGQTGLNAIYIGIGIVCVVANILNKNHNNLDKKIYKEYVYLIILFIAMLLTKKRGMLIFIIISSIWLYTIYLLKNNKKIFNIILKYIKLFIVLTIIVCIAIFTIPQVFGVVYRFFGQTDITNGRNDLYVIAIDLFKSHPWTGVGINRFPIYAEQLINQKIGAHNVILQLLAETGLIVTVYVVLLLLKILLQTIKKIRKCENKYMYISLGIQLIFILASLTGNTLYDFPTLILYFIAISLSKDEVENNEKCSNNFS